MSEARRRDALVVAGVALAARVVVVVWAYGRFPAVADGHYYDVLARRLASGAGYTWLWDDGAVTYAAHYTVGYPALLSLAYVVLGASGAVAMSVNALLGVAAAYGAHRIVDDPEGKRWRPMAAGLVVALHPALLPYTAALMTEGVTAALLIVAAALAVRSRTPGARWGWVAAVGVVLGVATLVRPQSLLLAPVLGALCVAPEALPRQRLTRAIAVTAVALACVAPWTTRNCVRMHRCSLVSLNSGWNLLIGAQTVTGGWDPLDVPVECATVWDEAGKDACFERAAIRTIGAAPGAWLARIPAKLGVTLDYFGAAPWYLHESNADAFGDTAKLRLAKIEIVASRLLLLGALLACGMAAAPRALARRMVGLGGVLAAVTVHAWLAYSALVLVVGLLGPRAWARAPVAVPCGAAVVALTLLVHAVFFGSGRYGLVVAPFVAAMAFSTFATAKGRSPHS